MVLWAILGDDLSFGGNFNLRGDSARGAAPIFLYSYFLINCFVYIFNLLLYLISHLIYSLIIFLVNILLLFVYLIKLIVDVFF